jgi:hypothetical protein
MKKLIVAFAVMAASACSSMPGEQSLAGFTEEPMSGGRYRIAYAAQDEASAKVVADRALARAAQVTLDAGNEWFEVQSKIDGKLDGHNTQTLVIVMGKGESLAGGPKQYDAKQTLASLRDKIS